MQRSLRGILHVYKDVDDLVRALMVTGVQWAVDSDPAAATATRVCNESTKSCLPRGSSSHTWTLIFTPFYSTRPRTQTSTPNNRAVCQCTFQANSAFHPTGSANDGTWATEVRLASGELSSNRPRHWVCLLPAEDHWNKDEHSYLMRQTPNSYLIPPQRGFPWNCVTPDGLKTRMMGLRDRA